MDELLKSALLGFKLAYVTGLAGAAFAFGVACVWRWMKWAPINITVNVNQADQ